MMSPDGKHVAYVTRGQGQTQVVTDGKPGPVCNSVQSLLFSPDGTSLAYLARQGAQWRVVLNGKESAPYDEILPPLFSSNSQHLAYAARIGEQWFAVMDTHRSGPYGRTARAHLQRQSALRLCGARRGQLARGARWPGKHRPLWRSALPGL